MCKDLLPPCRWRGRKSDLGLPGLLPPLPKGHFYPHPPISRGCIQSQATLLPLGLFLSQSGGSPDISWVLRTANIHLLPDRWHVSLGYQSGSADKAPCQRSPVGMAGCRWGLRTNCPQPMATSRSLLSREQLLAETTLQHPKATCPRAISWGGSQHLCFWVVERLTGLREGQRNPPLTGTAAQTRLPGGRGDENESLLPNLQETKKRKSGMMSPC